MSGPLYKLPFTSGYTCGCEFEKVARRIENLEKVAKEVR
jgi:hypothetical protein